MYKEYKMTQFRIHKVFKSKTTIHEYWDDKHIRSYVVDSPYYGGDIMWFIFNHNHHAVIHWENLQQYLETTQMLF